MRILLHLSMPCSHIPTNVTQVICISDCAFLLSSMAETHFLISNPMAAPIGGGTALPIWRCLSRMFPKKWYVSRNPCDRAHSRTLTTLFCLGCSTRPCLPIGSGFVTVVLKNPSHSKRPYSPAHWLCLLPVWGRHQQITVLYCTVCPLDHMFSH